MYRSILVPLDGSAFAEHALPFALSIARQAGACLQLVRVHVPFIFMYADNIAPGLYESEGKAMEQERAYLDDTVKRIATVSSVAVTSALVEGPMIAEAIQGHAAASRADLIVMTTHGRGPVSRVWLGSVSDEMVRWATTPILLMRPQEKPVDLAFEPVLQHILIPLDGSALAEQVLDHAGALRSLTQSDYTFIRVYGPEVDLDLLTYAILGDFKPGTEQLRLKAEEYLNHIADRLRGQGVKVQTRTVLGQHPATAILGEAQSLSVDLIALATHGRRGLRRLLLGSVADKVIRGASTPVLVHRSPDK